MEDEDDTNGRQGAVQDIEPAAEIPVEPDCRHRADDTGDQHHRLLGQAEDVGQAQAGGVQRIVVGGPDIQAQHQNGQVEEIQVEHNLENIVSTHINAGNGTEQEHQAVAQEEGDDGGDKAHFSALGKAGEVGRGRTAGNEAAHHQAGAGDDTQVLAALGELLHQAGITVANGHNHSRRSQDSHGRNGNVADDGKALDAEVGAGGHQDTGDGHQQVALPGHAVGSHLQAQQFLGHGDGEHRQAHSEPADLRETDPPKVAIVMFP